MPINHAILAQLLSKRDKILSNFSRFRTWVNNQIDTCSLVALSLRLTDFKKLKEQLELEHENTRVSFDDEFYNMASLAEHNVIELKNQIADRQNSKINAQAVSQAATIQLAPINIKSFSGLYTEWLPFYNTFTALVHNDTRFNEIQKFYHLKNGLRGDATNSISALTISTENYQSAWNILKTRFQNQRLIVQHHLNNIFNLTQCQQFRQLFAPINRQY